MKKTVISAFPREDYQTDDAPGQRGMSLRAYFAAKALQGILACDRHKMPDAAFAASDAVMAADALLAELEKVKP